MGKNCRESAEGGSFIGLGVWVQAEKRPNADLQPN
jgi:hypothetical protein